MTSSYASLWRIATRTLTKHAWQSGLMILGIALGVAVVVAIDLANATAGRAFDLSTETIAGRASHQIVSANGSIPEDIYAQLRKMLPEVPAAPVVSALVVSPQLGNVPMQLLGVDPFAEAPFRNYLAGDGAPPIDQLAAFLVKPGAVILTTGLVEQYGLEPGESFQIEVDGKLKTVWLAGQVQPTDRFASRALAGLVIADIATAQETAGRVGVLNRIDLILTESHNPVEAVQALLPPGIRIEETSRRSGSLADLAAAFQVNLTALSLLALVVGLFLIYNTMTFSVVQRRALFGTLRCLGVTRREVFSMVLREALIVGFVASLFGIGLGILLGRTTTRLVLQTVNDLYFTTVVREVGIPLSSLVKGAVAGLFATLLTAIPPAWEAASVPPRAALLRSTLEVKARRRVYPLAILGISTILVGILIFSLPFGGLIAGFTGTLAVVVGFSLLSGVALVGFTSLVRPLLGRLLGAVGRMAPRNLAVALSRTSVAVAALMVAVSVAIAVSLMIASFRHTVIAWLDQTLQGDIYISAPMFTSTRTTTPIETRTIEQLAAFPGARRMDLLRSVEVASPNGPVVVAATDNPDTGAERLFKWRNGTSEQVWQAMLAGAVIISEPLATRLGIEKGSAVITLFTPQGERSFPVIAVYYDYSSSQGTLAMELGTYQQIWKDLAITSIGLRLQEGEDPEAVTAALQATLSQDQRLIVRPNRILREEILEIFDRTFAITGALQILATLVAFIGVLNALLLLQLEKQREIGILRSIGLTGHQLWGLVMLESGILGAVAGLLAMPAGYALSLILVYIINRRSFGWTLQMAFSPESFAQAFMVALIAALLAAIYPAARLARMPAAEAIRYE